MSELTRVQFDVDADGLALLEALRTRARLSTRKELFNYAMTLFEWALNERADGRRLGSYGNDDDSFRELQMPPIEAVAPKRDPSKTVVVARK